MEVSTWWAEARGPRGKLGKLKERMRGEGPKGESWEMHGAGQEAPKQAQGQEKTDGKSKVCFLANQEESASWDWTMRMGWSSSLRHLHLSCPICRHFTYHSLGSAKIGGRHVSKCPDTRDGQRVHTEDDAGLEGMGQKRVKGRPCPKLPAAHQHTQLNVFCWNAWVSVLEQGILWNFAKSNANGNNNGMPFFTS